MAVEKGKVKAALDKRFQGKSVSKNFKEKLAARWADKIPTDEDIETYIAEREEDILDAASEADRRVIDANKAKQDPKKDDPKDNPKPDADPVQDDPSEPAWAKALRTQMQGIQTELSGIKAKETAQTITDRFKKDERLKGIPEVFFKGRIPQKDEDFEAAVTEMEADYRAFAEENKLGAFGKDTPPANPAPGNPTTKVDADIVAYGKAQSAAVKPATV